MGVKEQIIFPEVDYDKIDVLRGMEQKINSIHVAVVGDDSLGHEGLVRKVNRHENWIKKCDIKIAGFIGGAVVVVFLIDMILRK